MTSRSYVFTENNPEGLIDWEPSGLPNYVRYAVYQHEIGENGTPHFQGYIEFNKPCGLAHCQKLIPGAHFEKRRGTRDEARDYAMKEETRVDGPYEYGSWEAGGQGRRTDCQKFADLIKKSTHPRDILEEMPDMAIKYPRAIQYFAPFYQKVRDEMTEVSILYGDTGVGKTHFVNENFGGGNDKVLYEKTENKWWDMYTGQENVLLDEFYGWIPYSQLLKLCDKYPLKVETKGSHVQFSSKRIFITSNSLPTEWYAGHQITGTFRSFIRRVKYWYIFISKDSWHRYTSYEEFINSPYLPNISKF